MELKVLERIVKVGEPVIAPKHITENGEYSAKAEGVTGFDPVTVEVDMQPAVEAGYQKGYNDANEALDEEALLQEGLMQQISMALDGKTGTSGYDQGHEAGKQAEYDAFWDAYQENGNRTSYQEAFRAGWTEVNFKPKYDIILGSGETNKNMFNGSRVNADLVEICEKQGITIDFAKCTRFEYTFYSTRFTRVGIIDARNATVTSGMFGYSVNLKTIDKIIMAETTVLANSAFGGCTALENITFDGVINTNVNLANSSNFSVASVQSIIDHLKDLTGATAQTLTFHATVGANLTDTQKAAISAKNWTLVY